jgi:uncharacterized membrane-anchored protein
MAPSLTTADEVVMVQMTESYRSLALAGVSYAAEQAAQIQRNERIIDGLRERLAEKDARIADLEAEIRRYTASMVSEAA